MPLKNSQYNALMRQYDNQRLTNSHQLKARMDAIYQKVPRLKEIHSLMIQNSASRAIAQAQGDDQVLASLLDSAEKLRTEKELLLRENHIDPDDMILHYHCPDCKDTGFVNGQKCHCFQQAAVNLLYDQSNIREILLRENFSTLNMFYYSKDAEPGKRSQYEIMTDVIHQCHDYIDHFDEDHDNLLFTGTTGVGKTFLSNCIAKELIESGHSVVYFTATELFNVFSKGSFSYDEEASEQVEQYVLDSDLLIIDDLGTERANSFTVSKLFYCINERITRKKGTIISTNLGPSELRDIYSERVASRILSDYQIIPLHGQDIRIKKKFGTT